MISKHDVGKGKSVQSQEANVRENSRSKDSPCGGWQDPTVESEREPSESHVNNSFAEIRWIRIEQEEL